MEMLVIMLRTLRRTIAATLLLSCGIRARATALGQSPREYEASGDVRRAIGVPALELARALADQRAEPAAERAETREAHREAHLGDGEVGGAQQVLCTLDATLGHVLHRRDPVRRLEQPHEVVLGQGR